MEPQRRSSGEQPGEVAGPWTGVWGTELASDSRLVLSRFSNGENFIIPGGGWRGFSDRVMGGISNAELRTSRIDGIDCIRLSGNVTRESNGGFIQMALQFGSQQEELNASGYKGVELLVYGNNEEYNVHVRTAECAWHDQSYRMTFLAKKEWQRLQIPWRALKGNRLRSPLDTTSLQRIAILGWMREFQADIALAELSLYR